MASDEVEEEPSGRHRRDAGRRFSDFDCTVCNANNPCDESFGGGDEVRCHYCGQEFLAQVTESGRLRLRET